MKKKACDSNNKQKERHIVSWSQEEDDILREQIGIHGTENWAIVASKFKDKTTRQCRRRWFTYLNSDFKKGGWSQEEDMLLCEAQKIFGNRWTEIAKVVSGRTDNAVKNRFSTLCKKRAKNEALAKENNTSCITTNNKRTRFHNGQEVDSGLETSMPPSKIRRKHIPDTPEDYRQLRPPFSVILHNCHNLDTFTAQLNAKCDEAVEDFLKQKKESDVLGFNISDMDIRSCDEGRQQSWRQPDLYQGSPDSSEYSTGSTVLSQIIEKMEPIQDNIIIDSTTNQDVLTDEFNHDLLNLEFNSPLQVTPLFRSMAAGIPSPQFSESERSFLLKTLGMESTPPKQDIKTSQPPHCKRALLHCL